LLLNTAYTHTSNIGIYTHYTLEHCALIFYEVRAQPCVVWQNKTEKMFFNYRRCVISGLMANRTGPNYAYKTIDLDRAHRYGLKLVRTSWPNSGYFFSIIIIYRCCYYYYFPTFSLGVAVVFRGDRGDRQSSCQPGDLHLRFRKSPKFSTPRPRTYTFWVASHRELVIYTHRLQYRTISLGA